MKVVYSDYVKLLIFNFFNKRFLSIVYISKISISFIAVLQM